MANESIAREAQDEKVDNRICLNTSDEIDKIRAKMSEYCCFGDYAHLESAGHAKRLREEFIPLLLAQLDYSDLEAIRRLCEGMAAHPVAPWVRDFAQACFEQAMARATRLYHESN